MDNRRLQNIIAESKFFAPLCFVVAGYALDASGHLSVSMWMQFLCFVLTVVLLEFINAYHGLLRVSSTMTGALLALFNAMAICNFPDIRTGIIQLCTAGFFLTVYYSYEHKRPAGWVYYAFLCLGLLSLVYVRILLFVPLFWCLILIYLRGLTPRSLTASLLGILTPYWFAAGWLAYTYGIGSESLSLAFGHFAALYTFAWPLDYGQLPEHDLLTLGWSLILAIISIVHYVRQGYHDNIKPRVFYNVLMVTDIATIIFMLLQPGDSRWLLQIHFVCLAPLLAHFMTLTRTWLTNISFFIIILVTLAITAYNVWMPSSSILSAMVTGAC